MPDQTLFTLIQEFPLFSNEEREAMLAQISLCNETKKERLKEKLIEAYKKLNQAQKKALQALETFQHENVNALFHKKEEENKNNETGELNTILNRLNEP